MPVKGPKSIKEAKTPAAKPGKAEVKADEKKKKAKDEKGKAELDVLVKLMPSETENACKTEKPEPQEDIQAMLYSAMNSKIDMPDEIVFILPNDKKNLEVKINDQCKVTEVGNKSPLHKRLFVHDRITKIDDTDILKAEKARTILKKPDTKKDIIIIHVMRDHKTEREFDEMRLALMQQRVHLIRHGFKYFVLELHWKPECKMTLGLMVCHVKGKVLVRRFVDNSISAAIFKEHDHIMDINGAPVFERNEAKELLLATLHRTGWASILMERADTSTAKSYMSALTARGDYLLKAGDEPPPAQITQPKDVSTLVNNHLGEKKKQKEAGKGKLVKQPKTILRATDPTRSSVATQDTISSAPGSIRWPQEETKLQKVYEVPSDIQLNKQLKPVPKPQAPSSSTANNTTTQTSAIIAAPQIVSIVDMTIPKTSK